MADTIRSVLIGETLSHFRITAKLGEGGMGEVYLAEDTKLGREVAIKVLPDAFTRESERLARFEREARVLASLSHPNIAGIHQVEEEDGVHFLVMELASGETLAERLSRGPVPVDEAIPIALQIAQAIEAAHEQGIVHRDLKPGNVKVSEEGDVKVLDFGLAKALQVESTPSVVEDLSLSPTLTIQPTAVGVLLGTAAYMSPEQARGRSVDKRADIWAFGVVLWEMLTGQRLFHGESVSDVLAAVLREEPPDALPRKVPDQVKRLLDRCLERDPNLRLRDIGEARIALAQRPDAVDGDRRPGLGWTTVTASGLAAATLVAALAWVLRPATGPVPVVPKVSFSFGLPAEHHLLQSSPTRAPVEVAPDASFVVFSARAQDAEPRIFRRSIDSEQVIPVEGGEGGLQPFVSPDSRRIGFFTSDGGLAKVAAEGGIPERIYDGGRLMATGAFWGDDNHVYFALGLTGGIAAVPAAGGEIEQLTTPDTDNGEIGHWNPRLLPGGRALQYGVWSVDGWRNRILDLATGELRDLGTNGSHPQYVDSGHLVWLEGRDLIAARFDPGVSQPVGKGHPVRSGVSSFHVSPGGTLVYMTRATARSVGTLARWSEGEGGMVLERLGQGTQVRVSPNGGRLAVAAQSQLWIVDVDRGVRSLLTTKGVVNNFPVWSPDGTRLLFNSLRFPHGLYVRSTDAMGEAALVLARTSGAVYLPSSWSPDGQSVVMTELHPDGQADVAKLELDSGARTPLVATEAAEHSPAISPDGRWLAYTSDVSGRDEIYIQPFLHEGRRTTVSTAGGSAPRWASDGKTLFFRQRSRIFEVALSVRESELDLSAPRLFAEIPAFFEWGIVPFAPVWDSTPSGHLIYLQTAADQPVGAEIHVVLDWSRELAAPQG